VTERDRLLATLTALFVPERAAAMLAHLAAPGALEASAHAASVATLPRRERLQALSAALSAALSPDVAAATARADAVASSERSRIGAIVRAVAAGSFAPGAVSPIVLRLVRERLGR
jgi:hypothetical protein